MRELLGVLTCVVFIEFALVYGSTVWKLNPTQRTAYVGVGAIVLCGAFVQYKASLTDSPVDLVSYAILVANIIAIVGLTGVIIENRKEVGDG